jgi:hypothetical protein
VRWRLGVLLLAGVLAAAGCSSGGTSKSTTTTTRTTVASPARAAYVRKADKFCARIRPEFQKIPSVTPDHSQELETAAPSVGAYEDLRRFAVAIVAVVNRHDREIASIRRPKGDRLVEQWFNAYEGTRRALEILRLGAASHKSIELQDAIQRNSVAGRHYQQLSAQLGFKVCGAT